MDGVFESYYLPRVLAPQDIAARAMAPITLIPFEEARRATLQAQRMAVSNVESIWRFAAPANDQERVLGAALHNGHSPNRILHCRWHGPPT